MHRAAHHILNELLITILLNECLEILGRRLGHTVQINQVKVRLADVLHQDELLFSELNRLALFDYIVPPGDFIAVDGLEK